MLKKLGREDRGLLPGCAPPCKRSASAERERAEGPRRAGATEQAQSVSHTGANTTTADPPKRLVGAASEASAWGEREGEKPGGDAPTGRPAPVKTQTQDPKRRQRDRERRGGGAQEDRRDQEEGRRPTKPRRGSRSAERGSERDAQAEKGRERERGRGMRERERLRRTRQNRQRQMTEQEEPDRHRKPTANGDDRPRKTNQTASSRPAAQPGLELRLLARRNRRRRRRLLAAQHPRHRAPLGQRAAALPPLEPGRRRQHPRNHPRRRISLAPAGRAGNLGAVALESVLTSIIPAQHRSPCPLKVRSSYPRKTGPSYPRSPRVSRRAEHRVPSTPPRTPASAPPQRNSHRKRG